MADLASLGIKLETSEVKSGAKDLDQLTTAATRTEAAVEKLGPAAAAAGRDLSNIGNGSRTLGPGLANQARQFQSAGISARQYSAALRTVPAQITDIVTGLAGGQNPFLVAIQQGGQLRDQFGGFGTALRALGTILTPTRLLIGGLAGAVFGVAAGAEAGRRESFEFAKAIALSGNAAGVTKDELRSLARELDGIAGSESQAASTLALLTSTGQVGAENLKEFAAVAQSLERSVGIPVEETVKKFAALGADPVAAAKKLNQQYNFLTASTLAQIRALEEQGRVSEAAALAQSEFANSQQKVADEVEKSLGSIQRLGKGIASAFSEAKDAILSIGREATGAEKLADLEDRLASARRNPVSSELFGDSIASLSAQVEKQKELNFQEQLQAGIAASRIATEKLLIEVQEIELKQRREAKALAEQERKLRLSFDLSGIQRSLDAQQSLFANQESRLDLLRQAGLIKDKEFFDRKRQLIEESTAAQVAAKEAENQRLRAEQTSGIAQLETQQTIKENEADIIRLRAQAAAQLGDLSFEQQAANESLERSYLDAKEAADQFLKSLELQFQRQQQLQGLGTKARDRQGQRDDLADRFQGQRDQLQGERRRGEISEEDLQRQLKLIDEASAKAAAAIERNFAAIDMQSMDFLVGAQEAFANYIDDAQNVAAQSRELFTNAFNGIEDALVTFATTGKLSFKDLAQSIIADLIRIQIRALIVRSIAGFAGAGGGAIASLFGGARAAGGPVESGTSYLVGERGPELFVPRSSGQIINARATEQMMGGRAGPRVTINQYNTFSGGMDQVQMRRMLQQSQQQTVQLARSAISEDLRRGRLDTSLTGSQR